MAGLLPGFVIGAAVTTASTTDRIVKPFILDTDLQSEEMQ